MGKLSTGQNFGEVVGAEDSARLLGGIAEIAPAGVIGNAELPTAPIRPAATPVNTFQPSGLTDSSALPSGKNFVWLIMVFALDNAPIKLKLLKASLAKRSLRPLPKPFSSFNSGSCDASVLDNFSTSAIASGMLW